MPHQPNNENLIMKIFNIEATDMGANQSEISAWIMSATHGIDYAKASDFDEGALIEKACKALGWASAPQHGGLIVEWAGMFMNEHTGSVAPYINWIGDSSCWEGDVQAQLEALIEVVRDDCGGWVEV
jgi:hypothetical protein